MLQSAQNLQQRVKIFSLNLTFSQGHTQLQTDFVAVGKSVRVCRSECFFFFIIICVFAMRAANKKLFNYVHVMQLLHYNFR